MSEFNAIEKYLHKYPKLYTYVIVKRNRMDTVKKG